MRKGTFLDMRSFFDNDSSINKNTLALDIIDSCTVKGCQFVLPLRYDAPVIYVFDDVFSDYQIDPEIFSLGFDHWMETVIELQDPVLACGAEFNSITVFSDLIDYDTGEIIISEEKLSDYLLCYQKVEELIGQEAAHRSHASFTSYLHGFWTSFPVQVGKLSHSLYYSVIAKCENRTLNMYPLKTIEGNTFAYVTYYAAIASYCKNPGLAYEVVSFLLSEDFQWGINQPTPTYGQYPGLIESSWPILTQGSVKPLLDNLKKQLSHNRNNSIKLQNILEQSLDDSSIPVLHTEYDRIVFPFLLNKRFDTMLAQLNEFFSGNVPTDVSITELAKEVILNLQCELTS